MAHENFGFKDICFAYIWIFRWTTIIVVGIALVLLGMLGCAPSTPKKVNEVIFEKSEFSVPIKLTLPTEDNPKVLERLESEVHGLPPAFLGSRFRIDEREFEILVRHGLANIKKITARYNIFGGPIQTKQYEVVVYSDKIRPYIYKGDFKKYSEGEFEIRLASRVLKSIDYKNEYKEGATKIFAVTFSYTLKKDFPSLEELVEASSSSYRLAHLRDLKIDKTYKGKAQAYLDPSDGQWKLRSIVLDM